MSYLGKWKENRQRSEGDDDDDDCGNNANNGECNHKNTRKRLSPKYTRQMYQKWKHFPVHTHYNRHTHSLTHTDINYKYTRKRLFGSLCYTCTQSHIHISTQVYICIFEWVYNFKKMRSEAQHKKQMKTNNEPISFYSLLLMFL